MKLKNIGIGPKKPYQSSPNYYDICLILNGKLLLRQR